MCVCVCVHFEFPIYKTYYYTLLYSSITKVSLIFIKQTKIIAQLLSSIIYFLFLYFSNTKIFNFHLNVVGMKLIAGYHIL